MTARSSVTTSFSIRTRSFGTTRFSTTGSSSCNGLADGAGPATEPPAGDG